MSRTKESIEMSEHMSNANMGPIPGYHPLDILLPQLTTKKERITAMVMYSYYIEGKLAQMTESEKSITLDVSQEDYQKRGAMFDELFDGIDFSNIENCKHVRKTIELRFNWGQWALQGIMEMAEVANSK